MDVQTQLFTLNLLAASFSILSDLFLALSLALNSSSRLCRFLKISSSTLPRFWSIIWTRRMLASPLSVNQPWSGGVRRGRCKHYLKVSLDEGSGDILCNSFPFTVSSLFLTWVLSGFSSLPKVHLFIYYKRGKLKGINKKITLCCIYLTSFLPMCQVLPPLIYYLTSILT